jgi:pimeloyl-ACP methyl ester carboxylesterase
MTTRSGATLHYRDRGLGPTVLLLHGWGIPGACFAPQIEALRERYRVVAPDLRGHGTSSPLQAGDGLASLAQDVTDLMTGLGLKNTIVVGWSMGAMLGWQLSAGGHGNNIRALVTIDMVPRLLNDDGWRFGLRSGEDSRVYAKAAARMASDWPGFARIFVPRIFARGSLVLAHRRELCDRLIDMTNTCDPASMAQLWLSMVDQDLRPLLAEIRIPVLVTYGRQSQLYTSEASRWVHGQLADAQLLAFAHSGHAPHLEEPERFRQVLDDFRTHLATAQHG